MTDKAREKGRTERYLPHDAWSSMSKSEREATDAKKRRDSKGKKVGHSTPNTEAAKRASKKARAYKASKKS